MKGAKNTTFLCPVCGWSLLPALHMILGESASGEAASPLRQSYRCENTTCESYRDDIVWTFLNEVFILHRIETRQDIIA